MGEPTPISTRVVELHAPSQQINMGGGDVLLTQRTWIRDAAEMPPGRLITMCWCAGFGLLAGAAGATLLGLVLLDLWRMATAHA